MSYNAFVAKHKREVWAELRAEDPNVKMDKLTYKLLEMWDDHIKANPHLAWDYNLSADDVERLYRDLDTLGDDNFGTV